MGLFAVVLILSLFAPGHMAESVTHPLFFPFPAGRGSAGYTGATFFLHSRSQGFYVHFIHQSLRPFL